MNYFCITVRWFDDRYHGKDARGEPEWPPSPLRLFQALLASAYRSFEVQDSFLPSFRWLQTHLHAPIIVAPRSQPGRPYARFVPNNDSDKKYDRQERLAAKEVRPTLLLDPFPIHYVWKLKEPLPEHYVGHAIRLCEIAKSVTAFGWGVDMAIASGSILSDEHCNTLQGERWFPNDDMTGKLWRIPGDTTLDALIERYKSFVNRLQIDQYTQYADGLRNGCLSDLPPLDESAFRVVGYRRSTDAAQRPFAAFSILKPDASGNRSFETPRRARDVAAWIRHVTGQVCVGWPFGEVAAFIHGHDENGNPLKGDGADSRFMYLPLPTINYKLNRVESIRRVLIAAPADCKDQIDWVRRRLPGQELQNLDGQTVGLLNILPTSDWVLRQYVGESRVWSTVTPVIWPGHDDHDARKAEGILRKAFVHAGVWPELVAAIEELDWRPVGFRAGLDLAHCYRPPDKVQGRQYHVRVRFPYPIWGPLAIGAGRYRGLGAFAAEGEA